MKTLRFAAQYFLESTWQYQIAVISDVPPRAILIEESAPSPIPISAYKRGGIGHWSEIEIAILSQAWCEVNENAAGLGLT